MTKKNKTFQQHNTQELMTTSMECWPLGVLSEGLNSDLLTGVPALLISYRCEFNSRKHLPADGLEEAFDGVHFQRFC